MRPERHTRIPLVDSPRAVPSRVASVWLWGPLIAKLQVAVEAQKTLLKIAEAPGIGTQILRSSTKWALVNMFFLSLLFTLFLHFSAYAFAAPASNSASVSLHTNVNPNILLRNNQSEPSSNGTGSIPYKVDGTPITLLITPLLGQKISREDLIIALYDSREYVRRHIRQQGDGRLSGKDEPFSSTKLPSPPDVNCVVAVKSGKMLKSMTYKYLADVVQGLMDYTFFPYTASTSSVTFEVSHDIWGTLGTGSLSAFQPQVMKGGTAR